MNAEFGGPYAAAAWKYWNAGWVAPIPVGYGPCKKNPPVKGFTGWTAPNPSGPDIQTWVDGPEGSWNIGVHVPHGLYGLDVDDYHGGGASLAELEKQVGQPLPKTWTSTSKGEGQPSRHHYFKAVLPEGRVWINHPLREDSGLDALHVGHRYGVNWPSVHPSGDTYFWYDPDGYLYEGVPNVDELAELPDAWIMALTREGAPMDGTAATDEVTREYVGRFRTGAPCRWVVERLDAERDRIAAATRGVGGIHNPGQFHALAALGMEGHAGVGAALAEHHDMYVQARVEQRKERPEVASAAWWRMLTGTVGKKLAEDGFSPHCRCGEKPASDPQDGSGDGIGETEFTDDADTRNSTALPVLPDHFWTARPYLEQIREVAHGRAVSADVVFYTTLARLSGMVPHTARVHTGIKGKKGASLNLFVAVYDDSGAGKSSSVEVAEDLLMKHEPPGGFIDGVSIGSGQGIAELYIDEVEVPVDEDGDDGKPKRGRKTKTVRQQVRHAAYVYVDEGQALTTQIEAKGSVLGATLRTAATGGTLGQANATKDRYRHVPGGSYSLGMLVGFQRSTVGPLLADATAGTPQRFLWAAAADPNIVDSSIADHTLMWDPTALGRGLALAPKLRASMRSEAIERATGRKVVESLNAHRPIMVVKVAGLLAILDKRTEVDESDWALAEIVWDTSCAVRTAVIASLASASREEAQVRTQARIGEAVSTARALVDEHSDRLDRIARKIAKAVHDGGKTKRKEIRTDHLSSKDRPLFEEALKLAIDNDWIEPSDIDGHDYKVGSCRPL